MTNFIWMYFLALFIVKKCKMLLESLCLCDVIDMSQQRQSQKDDVKTKHGWWRTRARRVRDFQAAFEVQRVATIWLLQKGDGHDKSLTVCKIRKGQIKYNSNTTTLSSHLLRHHGIENNTKRPGTLHLLQRSCSSSSARYCKSIEKSIPPEEKLAAFSFVKYCTALHLN